MSHGYRAVGWNRQKRRYDGLVWLGIALYIGVFAVVAGTRQPPPTAETVLIRAFGTCALVLLHVILSIGPLCRLNPRWLPLLYNRRHLGVSMFLVALVHAAAAFVQFHALGVLNPFVSLLVSDGRWLDGGYPFQPLGLIALIILFGMAATSHDFWLANLSPPIWKTLHMAVYVAYGLIVLHVGLGLLQTARTGPLVALLGAGMAWVLGLHLAAGWRERAADVAREANAGRDRDDYVDCGPASTLADGAARVVSLGGERVAVFRYGDRVSAVSNVCRHQNGPLGEGRIIDGLITCPWHGYQYRPDDGCSPPPFDERVPTFRVRVADGRVWVHPAALPAGTRVEPARIVPGPGPAPAPAGGAVHRTPADAFYVGYAPRSAPTVRRFVRRRVVALIGGGACIAAAVAAALPPNAPSHFFYGEVRTYTGRLDLAPVPMLTIAPLPGEPDVDPRLILVGEGKHGVDRRALASLDHRIVRLRGTPASLGAFGLIEVVGGSVQAADEAFGPPEAPRVPSPIAGGTLLGEITEGKCALGVMNPGWGVVHRACASLCLRGGIPPMFIGRPARGGIAASSGQNDGIAASSGQNDGIAASSGPNDGISDSNGEAGGTAAPAGGGSPPDGQPLETLYLIAGADGAPIDPVVAAGWAGRPIELPVLGAESSAGWTIVYTDPAQWRAADGSGAHAFGASAVVHNVFCRVAVPPPSALPKDS